MEAASEDSGAVLLESMVVVDLYCRVEPFHSKNIFWIYSFSKHADLLKISFAIWQSPLCKGSCLPAA